jgi:hypothetical protein
LDGLPTAVNADLTGPTIFIFAGDADRDRSVDLDDLTRLAANFGQTPRGFSEGDFNWDAVVNLDDFTILASQFGMTLPAPADVPRAGSASTQAALPSDRTRIALASDAEATSRRLEATFSRRRISDDLPWLVAASDQATTNIEVVE